MSERLQGNAAIVDVARVHRGESEGAAELFEGAVGLALREQDLAGLGGDIGIVGCVETRLRQQIERLGGRQGAS